MKCLRLLLGAALLALGSPLLAQSPQNNPHYDEVIRRGNLVEHVGAGQRSAGQDEFVEAMGPPASDAGKWFVSIISSKNCQVCARLKADWQRSPDLKAFAVPADSRASWAHFNWYMAEDKSQAYRFASIKLAGVPTILVQPPRTGRYGDPATIAFLQTGYDGDPAKLARSMAGGIRLYVSKLQGHQPARKAKAEKPAVAGWGQIAPWDPAPREPSPFDVVPSPLLPSLPQIPPVGPAPPEETPSDSKIPDAPELVVITNEQGLGPDDHARIQLLANRVGRGTRVRYLDFRDVAGRYPIKRDETPAILATSDGRVTNKISGSLLPFLLPLLQEVLKPVIAPTPVVVAPTPAPVSPVPVVVLPAPVPVSPTVGIQDLPWSAVATLVAGGFSVPAVIALGAWAFLFVRSRRVAAGHTPIISDVAMMQIIGVAQQLLTTLANKPNAPPPATPPGT